MTSEKITMTGGRNDPNQAGVIKINYIDRNCACRKDANTSTYLGREERPLPFPTTDVTSTLPLSVEQGTTTVSTVNNAKIPEVVESLARMMHSSVVENVHQSLRSQASQESVERSQRSSGSQKTGRSVDQTSRRPTKESAYQSLVHKHSQESVERSQRSTGSQKTGRSVDQTSRRSTKESANQALVHQPSQESSEKSRRSAGSQKSGRSVDQTSRRATKDTIYDSISRYDRSPSRNYEGVGTSLRQSEGSSLKGPNYSALSEISSDSSESTMSVVNMYEGKLPLLLPRRHDNHCALEVSILEKHREGCMNRKGEREGRNPLEDKVGSYDVVNRIIYPTCTKKEGEAASVLYGFDLRNSPKGFKLNDPETFGKDLSENRSRIEALPILPDYSTTLYLTESEQKNSGRQNDNLDVLSVYIRMDRSEKVPPGFQKMHYRGDSCKLHDPEERGKQIMNLQKVIDDTSSGAELAKSNRRFSPNQQNPFVMTAVTNAPDFPPLTSPIKLSAFRSPPELPKAIQTLDLDESEEESLPTLVEQRSGYSLAAAADSMEVVAMAPRPVDGTEAETTGSAFFRCFRRKVKKMSEPFLEEDRGITMRRVIQSQSPPRRHSTAGPNAGSRRHTGQYASKRL